VASKIVNSICANAVVFAGTRRAFENILVTKDAGPSGLAFTKITVDLIDASSAI